MWTICTILRNRRLRLSICLIYLALIPIWYLTKGGWWAIASMMVLGLWPLAEIHLDFAVFKRFVARLRSEQIPCSTCALPLTNTNDQTCPGCHTAIDPEYVRLATGGALDRAELRFRGSSGKTRNPAHANRTFFEDFVCSDCGYSLQGLADNRCPECGEPFNPADPRTYGPHVRKHRWLNGLADPVQAAIFGTEAAAIVVAGQAYSPEDMPGWAEVGWLLAILGLLVLFMSWWVRAAGDLIACLVPMIVCYAVGYWTSDVASLMHTSQSVATSAILILMAGFMCHVEPKPRRTNTEPRKPDPA